MKVFFIFITLSIISVNSFASIYAGYNRSFRLEKNVNGQEYSTQGRNSIFFGYKKNTYSYQLQYFQYNTSSENGTLKIDLENHEILFLVMKELEWQHMESWYSDIGGGFGTNWDQITSYIGSNSVKTSSDKEIVISAYASLKKKINKHFSIGTNMRLSYSDSYSMKPALEVSLIHLNYQF